MGLQIYGGLSIGVTTRIQITTTATVLAEAVEGAFGMNVDYAMLIKLYGAPSDNLTRLQPATCIGIRTGILAAILIGAHLD